MRRIRQCGGFITPMIALIFFMVCLSGCGGERVTPEEKNKALATRFWQEGWTQEGRTVFDQICAPDLINHDPNMPGVTDLETYKDHVALHVAAFPAVGGVTIDDIVAQGDGVAVRWTWSVTHEGEYMGIPPTGDRLTMTGITFHRFLEGRVAENWHQYDTMGFLQQLSAAPPMGREDFTWGRPMESGAGAGGDPEVNVAIYRREAEELWNAKDLEVVEQIFSDNFVNHDPAWPGVTDRANFKAWAAGWLKAAPDMELVIEDIVAQGDKVAGRWTARWTDVAGMGGTTPTGKEIVVTGMDICSIADGKIAERWWAKDILGAMQQMGVIPPVEGDGQ